MLIWIIMFLLVPAVLVQADEAWTLERFLREVEARNLDLETARRDLQLAAVSRREARSLALPKIMAQGGYNRNLQENVIFMDFPNMATGQLETMKIPISTDNEFSFNTIINQTLLSFKVGQALRAARQYGEMTALVYDVQRQALLTAAKKLFYQTLVLEKMLQVSTAAAENARENYEEAQARAEGGLISELALLQAEVRWRSLLPRITATRRNLQAAYGALAILAGKPVEAALRISGTLEPVPDLPPRETLGEILTVRPDFLALTKEKELRETNVRATRAELFPTLEGSFIYTWNAASNEFKRERENDNFILGLKLNIPLFLGGYTRAQLERARIEVDKTELRIRAERLRIQQQLRDIRLRLEEARQSIEAADKLREAEEKAVRVARAGVEGGTATQLDLKDAALYLDQARLNRLAAVNDYLAAFFDWQLAVGKVE